MDLYSGYPFWLIKNGLPYNYPKLNRNTSTQVVILGGGITGAIQAFYLAEAGINFIVVEKRSIGLGSTCASTALLQYQIDTPLSRLIEKIGNKNAVRSYALCASTIDNIENISKKIGHKNFEKRPTLFYASQKKDAQLVEKEFALHKQAGFDVELWSNKDIKKSFGFSAYNGMYSHHSAQIDAYAFCHQAFQYSIIKGNKVYDRTTVKKITHHENGVQLHTEDGYSINCDWLIYATGYEIIDFIKKDIVQLNTTWATISEQYDNIDTFWKNNALIWETKEPYLYMRTTTDNRIIIGGRDEEMNNPTKREHKMKDKTQQLIKDFHKLFPQYHFKPEFYWAGTFGSTKDGLPYIGKYKPKPRGLFALGFGGNGITFSVIAANILSDIVEGKQNNDEIIFSFDR